MRKAYLKLKETEYSSVTNHLLVKDCSIEQAAFLFVSVTVVKEQLLFDVLDIRYLYENDYEYQCADYLELKNETRAQLIKKAHDLDSALIEFHSHPKFRDAMFSTSDLLGFREFVPHVSWRLKGKPYAAVVVSPSGFDGLVWHDNPYKPELLNGIILGDEIKYPSALTIKYLERCYVM